MLWVFLGSLMCASYRSGSLFRCYSESLDGANGAELMGSAAVLARRPFDSTGSIRVVSSSSTVCTTIISCQPMSIPHRIRL